MATITTLPNPNETTPPTPPAPAARVWTKAEIVDVLAKNNFAVERALLVLFARQTADEQIMDAATVNNGMGFSGLDAEIFSSFAKQILKSRAPYGERLTVKQLAVCRKLNAKGAMRIAKYAGQLVEVANSKRVLPLAA